MDAVGLSGAVAIVTGGSKGYGTGIAQALQSRGARVWITGREDEVLTGTAATLGVEAFRADVTSPADWDALFERVLGEAGRLDILVNNAGAGVRIEPLAEQTDEEIEASIAVNLTGALFGCRRAAAVMQSQGAGTIVNVASVCARQSWPGYAVYSAAKAGLMHASRCLYTELRGSGVRVTTVIPSWGATSFRATLGLPERDPETEARCIQPLELGDLVAYICSLPPHLAIEDVTLWPLVQVVEPL